MSGCYGVLQGRLCLCWWAWRAHQVRYVCVYGVYVCCNVSAGSTGIEASRMVATRCMHQCVRMFGSIRDVVQRHGGLRQATNDLLLLHTRRRRGSACRELLCLVLSRSSWYVRAMAYVAACLLYCQTDATAYLACWQQTALERFATHCLLFVWVVCGLVEYSCG